MEPDKGPLLVHNNPFDWLDTKWALTSLPPVLSFLPVSLVDLSWYWKAVAIIIALPIWFGILKALRGGLRSKWIKEVLENNHNVFFDLAMALGEGRVRGPWNDSGHDKAMN